MLKKSLLLGTVLAAPFAATSQAEEKKTTTLDPIEVTAPREEVNFSLTVPDNDQARQQINRTPGGVDLVEGKELEDRFVLNYEDSLSFVPGVYAQKRFGEEVRLSIRGSGLSRGFHLRGINLLQDGIPFNRVDGAGDFQELDNFATQRLEVHKGGNALQHGGTTLGGAINTITKTGRSDTGHRITVEAGSDKTYRMNAQSGQVYGDTDLFISLTGMTSNGYRSHDDQQNFKFNGNVGTSIGDTVETRFYLSANDIDQELPGSVSRSVALNDPTASNASAASSDWKRDIRSIRLSNKTSFEMGDDEQLDIGGFVNAKELFHPITPFVGIIDQESRDGGLFADFSGSTDIQGHKNQYRIGLVGQYGVTDAKVFQNLSGKKGNLTANADQEAMSLMLYGENQFFLNPDLALIAGAQVTWSRRKVTDKVTPAESDSKNYAAFNPKIGVLYEPVKDIQLFANISKSDEVPTFSELTQSGTTGFTPVESQKAWTIEAGTRGSYQRASWDLSVYRAWIKDEMLQFTTGAGIPASTFNADKTIHQGVELGFDIQLAENLFSDNDTLSWNNSYTFADFYFDGDAQYGDNDIPGQARHFYQTELRYDHKDGWFIAPNIEVSSSADVDFENTLDTPGYALLNVSAGYRINETVNLYVDARNLLDRKYISTFSTIVNTAGNTAVFYPGEGFRAFAGMRVAF
ncbi:MAG: TonB-dependent receptor [Sneathiella sp.]